MNLNGNEKLIAQLFVEMSREDADRAPELARVLSSRSAARDRNWSVAFAAALAMLILAVAIGLLTARRKTTPVETRQPDARAEVSPAEAPALVPEKRAIAEAAAVKSIVVVRHRRHRRSPDQLAIQLAVVAKSLSEWQSPTASLLTYPGEDMFKTLPRLGDSLETIKSLSADQFN